MNIIKLIDTKNIAKKCQYHGDLTNDDIYIGPTGYRWCLHCKNKEPPTVDTLNFLYKKLKCLVCKEIKSIDNFFRNAQPKNAYCKPCTKIRKSEYRKRPEVRQREYISETNRHYLKKYGITFDDYEKMLKNQNGVCAICKKQNTKIDARTKNRQRFHVDHCHETKKVRGLLCAKCNQGIGFFNDNILLLESCIRYLQEKIK